MAQAWAGHSGRPFRTSCATRAKSHPAFRHRGAAGFLSTYGAM
jgi:hypothetical protein